MLKILVTGCALDLEYPVRGLLILHFVISLRDLTIYRCSRGHLTHPDPDLPIKVQEDALQRPQCAL